MIKIYKYLNGHSPDIINDIFKLRESECNLRNFQISQTENPCSLKYGLDAIPKCNLTLFGTTFIPELCYFLLLFNLHVSEF